jgi:hypothetical protein
VLPFPGGAAGLPAGIKDLKLGASFGPRVAVAYDAAPIACNRSKQFRAFFGGRGRLSPRLNIRESFDKCFTQNEEPPRP